MKLSFLKVGHTAAATADDVSRSSHGCLHMHMYMNFFCIYVFGVCIFATWFSSCVSLQDKFFPDRGNDLKVVALKVFPCFYLQSKRHVCFTLKHIHSLSRLEVGLIKWLLSFIGLFFSPFHLIMGPSLRLATKARQSLVELNEQYHISQKATAAAALAREVRK